MLNPRWIFTRELLEKFHYIPKIQFTTALFNSHLSQITIKLPWSGSNINYMLQAQGRRHFFGLKHQSYKQSEHQLQKSPADEDDDDARI